MARVGAVWTSPQEERWKTGVKEKPFPEGELQCSARVRELLLHFCETAQIIPYRHPIAHESAPQA